jgi:hypothetical protein
MAARPSPAEPARASDAQRSDATRRGDATRPPSARSGSALRLSSFAKLSLIALGCFGVGLSWPLLADLQFVQRPPGSTPAKSEEREPPPLDAEPENKPSTPPPAQRSPLARDQGVRAAAKLAPTSERASAPESGSDQLVVMSGPATIGWKAAVVRKGPSGQAETLERVAYGTRVSVTGRQGEWYRVKYGRKGQTGWVHRKALGL